MIIALDFDGTYTNDPEGWNQFVKLMTRRGHKVICVTMRYPCEGEKEDVLNSIGKYCIVFFTSRKAKKLYMDENGYRVDVWIDDNPLWLYQDG